MNIFISYRRADSQFAAGRLDDHLANHFGRQCVFFDTATIDAGAQYKSVIVDAIGQSDVFLPVIGATWLDASDDSGRRRLDDPSDLVRFEIETAVRCRSRIIPVFLTREVNLEGRLPRSLEPISHLNGVVLRPGRDFREDAISLVRKIGLSAQMPVGLLGRWRCEWRQRADLDDTGEPEWATEDVVEIFDVVGHRVFARGSNIEQGAFEMEGWWSAQSIALIFSGAGLDEPLKGAINLRIHPSEERLEGLWTQYARGDDRVIGGATIWKKMVR